ncbi:MAG: hypothetical protein QOJ89_3462 [bacterium]
MTSATSALSGALPPLAPGAVPASVRAAGADAERSYRTALAFERMLLSQVTKAMQATAEGDGEPSAATSAYMQMLPETMADSLTAGGGIGLADDLVRALRAPSAPAAPGGGATPQTESS